MKSFTIVLIATLAVTLQIPIFASDCSNTTVGLVPLTQLVGSYLGEPGGLYPGGLNVPPVPHDSAGRALGLQYQPLDTAGNVDSLNGVWILLSVGMSNCTQEFSTFVLGTNGDTTLHPYLRIVDGAQGGQTAAKIQYDTAAFWGVIESRLAAKGFSAKQVQAIWMKEADAGPTQAFPIHARILRDECVKVAQVVKSKYPNTRQMFISSRTYGGYASSALNPEPYAYEAAFAMRWLIEAQCNGNDSLNYVPTTGTVNSPWLAWGPYLWADGVIPRDPDSLQWFCADFIASDGTHPSTSGRTKVADLLARFFKNSAYSKSWFLRQPANTPGDANGDGLVTVSDIVFLINYIFSGGPAPDPLISGEADCSGAVNISDGVYLINFIFAGGPAPCSP